MTENEEQEFYREFIIKSHENGGDCFQAIEVNQFLN